MEETDPVFLDTEKFIGELWDEIKANGVYGRSKNDFYDYILYLLLLIPVIHTFIFKYVPFISDLIIFCNCRLCVER